MEYYLITKPAKSSLLAIRSFNNCMDRPASTDFVDDFDQGHLRTLMDKIQNWSSIPTSELNGYMVNICKNYNCFFYGYAFKQFCKSDVVMVNCVENAQATTYFEDPRDLMMLKLKG